MMGKDGSFVRWTPHPRTERMYDLDKVEFRDDGLVFTMLQDDDWRHDHRLRLTWIWGTVISYQVSEETSPKKKVWLNIYNSADNFLGSTYKPLLEKYDDLLNLDVEYIQGDGQSENSVADRLTDPSAYDAFAINMVKTDNAVTYTTKLAQ